MSCIFDALHSLGFEELQNFSEVEDLKFKTCYPIFRTIQIHNKRGIEYTETVERICFSGDLNFDPISQTILSAKLNSFTDVCESDVVIKTLFDQNYFPKMGVKYTDEKIYIILEDFYLETFLSFPASISS